MKKITTLIILTTTIFFLGCEEANLNNTVEEKKTNQANSPQKENIKESLMPEQTKNTININEELEEGQSIKGMQLVSIEPIMQNKKLDQWGNAWFTFEGSKIISGQLTEPYFDVCNVLFDIAEEEVKKLPLSERYPDGIAMCLNNFNREFQEGETVTLELVKYNYPAAEFGPIGPSAEIKE